MITDGDKGFKVKLENRNKLMKARRWKLKVTQANVSQSESYLKSSFSS